MIEEYIKRLEDSKFGPCQCYWFLITQEGYAPSEVMLAFEKLGQRDTIIQETAHGTTEVANVLCAQRTTFFDSKDLAEIEREMDEDRRIAEREAKRLEEKQKEEEPISVTISDDGYVLNTSKPITAANNRSYEEHISEHDNSGAPSVRNQGTGRSGEEREEEEQEDERVRRTYW